MARLPKSIIKKYGITKKAWSVFRGSKPHKYQIWKIRSSRKARHIGGKIKKMARRRTRRSHGHRSQGFSLQSIFKYIRFGSAIAPAIIDGMTYSGSNAQKLEAALMPYGGINMNRVFDWDTLSRRWTPFLVTTLVTYGIPKLTGIIRKL